MLGSLQEIAEIIKADFRGSNGDLVIENVSIDTRKISSGELYFALQGEVFDGHDFVDQAFLKGAAAAVVSKGFYKEKLKGQNGNISLLVVTDPLIAMQTLAKHHRNKYNIPVVAITGSNGKTSTKDTVAAVLAEKYNVLKTEGNFNNEIGLPLTLFRLKPEHDALVVEMGMRGLGEIDLLCKIASPTIGIITNIGITHMELLGTEENIAKAKGELVENIPEDGFCFLNTENKWTEKISQLCKGEVFYYGLQEKADFKALNLVHTEAGMEFDLEIDKQKTRVSLPLPGEHNVLNSLAAVGVAFKLGLSMEQIAHGLENVKLSAMRLAIVNGIKESIIINDAYNANPDSTRESLKVLMQKKKQRTIAVLGHMRELGHLEEETHKAIGAFAKEIGVAYVLTVGDLGKVIAAGALEAGMPEERVYTFSNNEEAKHFLKDFIEKDDLILIKASRAVQLEEIVDYVTDER